MISFSGLIKFTAGQPLLYDLISSFYWDSDSFPGSKQRRARYRVKIYQCEGVCSGGFCDDKRRKSCLRETTTILVTDSVFNDKSEAADWAEKCTNLIYELSQFSVPRGKRFIELKIG